MFLRPNVAALAAGACVFALAAHAQTVVPGTRALSDLVACRTVVADADRLRCYDRLVAALDQAETAGEVVIVERGQITEARRALFGFSVNPLPLFARRGGDEPLEAIQTSLQRASQGASGKWLFVLEDGSVWLQTDSNAPGRTPRPGADITVRQGAVGSYLLSVNGTRSVRVRRQE
ncbi:hypothetical protein [Brevundimonas sp. R86498]|uniref:hypothetical protein n=1 Tax=Brevundimonas sp. R86498 TaxID=3093845 RepID=UPI0037CA2DF9